MDLTTGDVDRMARREPGSARRYLEEKRQDDAQVKEKKHEEVANERYIEQFLAEGGTSKAEGEKAYRAYKNQQAAEAAQAADQEALRASRDRIGRRF